MICASTISCESYDQINHPYAGPNDQRKIDQNFKKCFAILQKHSDQCRIDHEITADLDLIDYIKLWYRIILINRIHELMTCSWI
jgi:hypothetical protein